MNSSAFCPIPHLEENRNGPRFLDSLLSVFFSMELTLLFSSTPESDLNDPVSLHNEASITSLVTIDMKSASYTLYSVIRYIQLKAWDVSVARY